MLKLLDVYIFNIINYEFLFYKNIYSLQNYLNPYLIFWSLSLIFQFYLLFAIILKIIFIVIKKLKKNII